MDSVLDDEEPLYVFGSQQVMTSQPASCCCVAVGLKHQSDICVNQPVRGPGDLRHDLERRRLERLEGVKVTICGSQVPQRPLGPVRWVVRVVEQCRATAIEYLDKQVLYEKNVRLHQVIR